MEKITVEFSPEEKAALKILAKKHHHTLEEIIERAALMELLKEDLIQESTSRNGWTIKRLDE